MQRVAPHTAHLRLRAQAPYAELLFGHESDGKMPLVLTTEVARILLRATWYGQHVTAEAGEDQRCGQCSRWWPRLVRSLPAAPFCVGDVGT